MFMILGESGTIERDCVDLYIIDLYSVEFKCKFYFRITL